LPFGVQLKQYHRIGWMIPLRRSTTLGSSRVSLGRPCLIRSSSRHPWTCRLLQSSLTVAPAPKCRSLSWGFLPFSASVGRTRFTRACLTRHLPPTGFLTLLTVYFPSDPLAFFHARNTHGVLSSGHFPPGKVFLNLSIQITLLMLDSADRSWLGPHLQGFFPCRDPILSQTARAAWESRCPPDFQLSKGFPRPALARLPRSLPS
jgi:hypothetical protein